MIFHLGAFIAFSLAATGSSDWPTYLNDNARSGHADTELRFPLHLHWKYESPLRPQPAWPDPAKQDFWHNKTALRARVTYDRANHVVVASKRMVFGSSSDDQVRCLDSQTGELQWTFFAEAPIRFAPSIWNGSVIFGSDDGYVYSLSLEDGKLNWRTRPDSIGRRRIPGNSRIISERPIRTGVLIENGTGYFAAGLFPKQGCFLFSLDLNSGRVIDQSKLNISPQGYLTRRDGKLFAPTGRDPRGAILNTLAAAARRSEDNEILKLRKADDVYSVVSDRSHYFMGRDNLVLAIAKDGLHKVWESPIDGKAYSLALADGALFVSTDQGTVYRFGTNQRKPQYYKPIIQPQSQRVSDVTNYLDELKSGHGFALIVEPTDLAIAMGLVKQSELKIVTVVSDEAVAAQFRKTLVKNGCYGRVVVHVVDSVEKLPYATNIFDLIVGGNRRQFESLLCPGSGIGFFDGQIVRREPLKAAGAWTHMYGDAGNTSCSGDSLVSGDLQLQWFGEPGPRKMVDRHLRTMPPLAIDGRMFIPAHDRVIAVNAYNGTILWETGIPNSTRIGILKDCGWMATDKNALLVAQADKCLVIDPATGSVVKQINVPATNRAWGYTAINAGKLVGSTALKTASRREVRRESILEGAYTDNRPIVTSDGLFAIDRSNDDVCWRYKSNGAILNPTLGMNEHHIFFVEKEISESSRNQNGRYILRDFLGTGRVDLVAVSAANGKPQWRKRLNAVHAPQNIYLLCTDQQVVVVNSRNDGVVYYDIRVYDARNGDIAWQKTQKTKWRTGGDHGEQDKHPVLIGHRLVVEPECYDLRSGERIADFDLKRSGHGCGTLAASNEAIFFRSATAAGYEIASGRTNVVSSVSRPGCWINMIPAAGLLLIPEGSSGCTCNLPIQCSMAFAPKSPKE